MMNTFLPPKMVHSEILLSYENLSQLWALIPLNMRSRVPQNVYMASEHGYNLRNVYARCREFN
jgi:hypothetical protein